MKKEKRKTEESKSAIINIHLEKRKITQSYYNKNTKKSRNIKKFDFVVSRS